jgi:hypothetical protein
MKEMRLTHERSLRARVGKCPFCGASGDEQDVYDEDRFAVGGLVETIGCNQCEANYTVEFSLSVTGLTLATEEPDA